MTTNSQRIYNLPIGDKLPNATHALRNPEGVQELLYQPLPGINNIQDLINHGYKNNAKKNFLGTRNPKTGVYEYETYEQVYEKAVAIGSSLQNMNLLKITNEYKNFKYYDKSDRHFDGTLKLVGIYAKNRAEWTICDMANGLYGYTMIPLYDTLGPESVSFVLGHSGITTCICSTQSMQILSQTKELHSLKNIIALDQDYSPELIQALEKKGLRVLSYQELILKGKSSKIPLPKNIPGASIFTFSYTSGTTGNPKGAMITHKNVIACVRGHQNCDFRFNDSDTHMSYLPLPHIFERFVNCTCWLTGAKIAFYGGDTLKLREDLAAAQPTVLISVPRVLNKFYDEINYFIANQPSPQRETIQKALNEKLQNLRKDGKFNVHHPVYDEKIFSNFKKMFGGKLRAVVSGSAPISQRVLDFLSVIFSCYVKQGYGQTEGTGLETVELFLDTTQNHVGGIVASAELKLQDVPEMGYFSTDKDENGNPMPRGEICIRGYTVFAGYYKDDEKTAEAFDEEGWLHSGDIGLILPNGTLRVFDRKKNIFKLQQGEYVSPEKIENIYVRARGVQEVFVHGDSLQRYCVAILVPKPEEILKIAKELNISETKLEVLCKNQQITQFYLKSVTDLGKKEGLHTFEQAHKVYLEPVSLVIHGCLTSSFKLQRHIARQVFKKAIEELYSTPLNIEQKPRL
ncbi:AMP-binding enzyme family protein (macronuclear) [Tetrahymena thermophila SB210]|uniref:AMP-binding enzyme family protein n=1 Tax=Tetrahymena thermophila (strain SB210) TaxID=312017 RepID=Q23YG8_TETTS|nr:AMP-binding enzyme family protein [Tetrahymena thermophila SB210]EAS01565.1 AMP-binding enzyme family protein [Tetrahymena thermophila SB210]|eukprot:XP_001021810.1 AMP-binding enzyme family protein [Tetrahymena thermophila SB210]